MPANRGRGSRGGGRAGYYTPQAPSSKRVRVPSDDQEVLEKNMFEYYGHIQVYSPWAAADNPLGPKYFYKHKSFCPFAHF